MNEQIKPVLQTLFSREWRTVDSPLYDRVIGKAGRVVGDEYWRVHTAAEYFDAEPSDTCLFSRGFSYAQLLCYCTDPTSIMLDVDPEAVAGVLAWLFEIDGCSASRAPYEVVVASCFYRWLDTVVTDEAFVSAVDIVYRRFVGWRCKRDVSQMYTGATYLVSNLSSPTKSDALSRVFLV